MKLHTVFRRRVGAVSADPVLGTDVLPSTLPAEALIDQTDNMARAAPAILNAVPVQRLAVLYSYAGIGPAPNVPVTAWCYAHDTQSWYQLGDAVSVVAGKLCYFDVPATLIPKPETVSDGANTLEVILIATAPPGAPDGVYTFGAVYDTSVESADTGAALAAILAELVLIYTREGTLSTEATLLKLLWGQSGSTAPTAAPDTDAVKTAAATPVAPAVYAGAGLNGVGMAAGALLAPRNVSVTTAAHGGTYKVGAPNAIVVTGTDYYTKQPVSEALLLTAVGGGETISGSVLFDAAALSIAVPAQNDALGAFEFGTGALVPGIQKVVARGETATDAAPAAGLPPLDMGAQQQDADPAAGTDTRIYRLRLDSLRRLFTRAYNWVTAKGASAALAITGKDIGPNTSAMDVYDNAPTLPGDGGEYSTAKGNGMAARASDTTVTFTGPAITSAQLCKVRVIRGATDPVLVWEQSRNATLTIAAGVITITPKDGTVAPVPAAGLTSVDVVWVGERKGYDPGSNSDRVTPTRDVSDNRTVGDAAVPLLGADYTLTGAWADLGPEVPVAGATAAMLWLACDINDSLNVRVRCLFKDANGGTYEYTPPIYLTNTGASPYSITAEAEAIEWNVDTTDFNFPPAWRLSNCVGWLQFQVMAGTVGATPGKILAAGTKYTYGYGG